MEESIQIPPPLLPVIQFDLMVVLLLPEKNALTIIP